MIWLAQNAKACCKHIISDQVDISARKLVKNVLKQKSKIYKEVLKGNNFSHIPGGM